MNWQTLLVASAVVAVFAAVVLHAALGRRRGKASCSCGGCSGCPMSGRCGAAKAK